MRRRIVISASVLLMAAAGLALLSFTAYTDYAFACEYTCSHMGYREWVLGFRTGQWYETSPIERRLTGEQLDHRWVSYAGTGYNLFGRRMSRGHGRPHAAALFADRFWPYFESLSDEHILELYKSFRRMGTRHQYEAMDESMWERLMAYRDAGN